MTAHDCAQNGHVWVEPDGQPYRRHRGRPEAKVSVSCEHCGATAELSAHGAFTAPPGPHPIDRKFIPPPFMAVLDRAVAAAPPDTGPAREP